MSMDKTFSVTVIGGGIGGLCLALGLLRRGVPVQVYEQAPAFGEIGQGIAFGPNSVRAMGLVDPAIELAFKTLATPNAEEENEDIKRTWINFRSGVDMADMFAKVCTSDERLTGLSSVHRARFMEELVNLVPEGIAHFQKRLINLRRTSSGAVQLTFEDGTIVETDAVVACDGIRSAVRPILLGRQSAQDDLSFAKTIAYRTLVPMEAAIEAIGKDLATNAQMYTAEGGHVLTYPIEHGKMMNVVASVNKSEWGFDTWVVKDAKYEDMKRDFAGWCEPVQGVLKAMRDYSPDLWGLFDSKPIPTFYKGNVALLGDAAHSSLPHQGAGAGQAIEDAFVLAEVLAAKNVRTKADVPRAFKAYDAIRRPRSQKVVSTSRVAGKNYKMQGAPGKDLVKLRLDALTRFNWIWYEDMEVQAERAVAILEEPQTLDLDLYEESTPVQTLNDTRSML